MYERGLGTAFCFAPSRREIPNRQQNCELEPIITTLHEMLRVQQYLFLGVLRTKAISSSTTSRFETIHGNAPPIRIRVGVNKQVMVLKAEAGRVSVKGLALGAVTPETVGMRMTRTDGIAYR